MLTFWEIAALLALPVSTAIGIKVGRNQAIHDKLPEHVHDWSQWIKLEEHQERFCHSCGFVQTDQDEACPPHTFGPWEDDGFGTYRDSSGERQSCSIQARYCTKCKVKDIRRIGGAL